MKMSMRQPSCTLLALYEQEGRCTVKGKVRRKDGTVDPTIELEHHGEDAFETLCRALEDAALLRLKHCAVFTNSPALEEFFTPPIKIPQPDKQTVRIGKYKTVEIPAGGNPHQWRILTLLLRHNRWKVWTVRGNQIKETREAWKQHWTH